MILYLHGFRSSPQSFKARLLTQRMADLGRSGEWLCPQLPASPRAAIDLALALVRDVAAKDLTIIGSSLGGFYATWLAEQLGCRAVLLNPAVNPPRELESQVGVTTAYHEDVPFEFRAAYLDELRALMLPGISEPARYFLVAATGDELLDWREMVAFYARARHRVINGSDHGISDFAAYADEVLGFAGIVALDA